MWSISKAAVPLVITLMITLGATMATPAPADAKRAIPNLDHLRANP